MTVLKKTLAVSLAAATFGATVLVTATPASAQWRRGYYHGGYYRGGAVAAGVLGGLALGALAVGAARSAEPVDDCWEERRPIYNRAGQVIGSRVVPVCN